LRLVIEKETTKKNLLPQLQGGGGVPNQQGGDETKNIKRNTEEHHQCATRKH
jgi:hypothetical protein